MDDATEDTSKKEMFDADRQQEDEPGDAPPNQGGMTAKYPARWGKGEACQPGENFYRFLYGRIKKPSRHAAFGIYVAKSLEAMQGNMATFIERIIVEILVAGKLRYLTASSHVTYTKNRSTSLSPLCRRLLKDEMEVHLVPEEQSDDQDGNNETSDPCCERRDNSQPPDDPSGPGGASGGSSGRVIRTSMTMVVILGSDGQRKVNLNMQ